MSCEDGDEEENIFRTPLSIHNHSRGVIERDIFLYLGDISIFLRTNPHTT